MQRLRRTEKQDLPEDYKADVETTIRQYHKMIHELFEAQVETVPNNVAVVYQDKRITYRELNDKANKLSQNLLSLKGRHPL